MIIYSTAVKTARMTATRDYFANGTLELLSAGDVVLAIFGLEADGGDIAGSVWTLVYDGATVPGQAAAGPGTVAAKARVKTSGGTVGLSGLTVGGSGSDADVELVNTSISEGQDVTLTTSTIAHAPDPS